MEQKKSGFAEDDIQRNDSNYGKKADKATDTRPNKFMKN